MPSLTELLTQNAAHAWLFLPVAILLGALHGLEPGHSKTMMAAFVIAMSGLHGLWGRYLRDFANDRNTRSSRFYRSINEIPMLFLLVIVIMVIVQPF